MNRKISIEIAIAIILVFSIIIGFIFWFSYFRVNQSRLSVVPVENNVSDQTGLNQQTKISQLPSADTSDWKIYKNDKYGFEFKYPSKWFCKDFYETNAIYSGMPYEFDIYCGDDAESFKVPPGRGGRGLFSMTIFSGGIAQLNSTEQNYMGGRGVNPNNKVTNTTFHGLEATESDYNTGIFDSNIKIPTEETRFEHSGKAHMILFENPDKTDDFFKIYNAMMNSFKFTENPN